MSMNVPALKVDFEKINENFRQGLIGPDEKVTGNTGTHYQGLGIADNAGTADDIAAFFCSYATETPETYFQQIDIFSKKGQAFFADLQKYSASINDDGYLSLDELQSWADENKYRGDINKVMQVLADVDNLLFGKGTMDIEYVDPAALDAPPTTEENGTEPTAPEEGDSELPEDDITKGDAPEDDTTKGDAPGDDTSKGISSLTDIIKGATKGVVGWMIDGVMGLGSWLFG